MKIVHIVLSENFAGIEQHVDELLSNNLLSNPILICNDSIADNFDEMIKQAKKAAGEIECKPKIMMVTILTALADNDLKDMGNNNTVTDQIEKLAKIAKEIEIGVVCSGHEAKIVREISYPDHHIFDENDLLNLAEIANKNQSILVTTKKDFVRIPKSYRSLVNTLDGEIEFEDEKLVFEILSNVIENKINSSV